MAGRQLGRLAGRLARATKPLADKAKASDFARGLKEAYEEGKRGDEPAPEVEEADAAALTDALRTVDWSAVRAATAERTSEAAQKMKALAAEVDWTKVQSGAARVSSALIAAVASGQIPVGGRLAGPVARAIINDRGLAQRVHRSLEESPGADPPDFRGAIDTTAREP